MEMRQVEYFRALADELNFTRAAKRCGVSQPSLTRSIRLLEEEFGGQLFYREGGKTRISELGQIVKPHLEEIFDHANAAASRAQTFKERKILRLKLGVMCTVAPAELVELLKGVRTRHPEVHLEVVDANASQLEQQLRDGELEIAVIGRPETTPRIPEFHYLPLYREQFMIVSGPEHRLSRLGSVRASDLHDEAYLRRVNCEMASTAARSNRERGIVTRTVYKSDRDDWILAMVAAGIGFALMPRRSVQQAPVSAAPLTEPEFWREISLATVRGRPHSPAIGALIHEAMRASWMDDRPLAVRQEAARRKP